MKKCYVEYVVSIWWKHLGKCEYRFSNFHDAYDSICYVRGIYPNIKITCKTERRDFPEWLNEIFTGT